MLVYGECECFVMQMLYVCVLCASCGSSQCCVLHDLQFVNAGRGCKNKMYLYTAFIYSINPLNAELVYIQSTVYFPWCLAHKYTTHNESSYDLTFL